ncbi:hypothetical protein C8R44DRAFT_732821 [Mycena epipterygia]|nr:hypothetical protein C8R44DRAFT_732821 [Mycena epipterygia]
MLKESSVEDKFAVAQLSPLCAAVQPPYYTSTSASRVALRNGLPSTSPYLQFTVPCSANPSFAGHAVYSPMLSVVIGGAAADPRHSPGLHEPELQLDEKELNGVLSIRFADVALAIDDISCDLGDPPVGVDEWHPSQSDNNILIPFVIRLLRTSYIYAVVTITPGARTVVSAKTTPKVGVYLPVSATVR